MVQKRTRIRILTWFLVSVLGVITIVIVLGWLLDISYLKALNMLQSVATVLAIGLGGVFAFYKLELFREFEPHLAIDQRIQHRRVGPNYIHIDVTTSLRNSSNVAVEVRSALHRIQVIAPVSDKEVERVLGEYSKNEDDQNYLEWPMYSQTENRWPERGFVIEPGGTDRDIVEFVVPSWIKTVLVYSYFSRTDLISDEQNETSDGDSPSRDDDPATYLWQVATVYDLSQDNEVREWLYDEKQNTYLS